MRVFSWINVGLRAVMKLGAVAALGVWGWQLAALAIARHALVYACGERRLEPRA